MHNLSEAGQVKEGATVVLTNNGIGESYEVVGVLSPGSEKEIIILSSENDLFFSTTSAIAGVAWAKEVKFSNPTAFRCSKQPISLLETSATHDKRSAQDEYILKAKMELWARWGVTGMPSAKIRLAEAAWDAAIKAVREGDSQL